MASITYWNRIEPVPRSNSLTRTMAAQVRDPLWFLARQWQFGEFRGQDSASPAYVQYSISSSPLLSWQTGTTAPQALGASPLEVLVEAEPFTPDLATAVELGQQFEVFLAEAASDRGMPDSVRASLRAAFLDAYPVPKTNTVSPDAQFDPELLRFLRVCGGRAIHGINLYQDYLKSRPLLPATPVVTAEQADVTRAALDRLVEWTTTLYGQLGEADAPAWRPERLEYNAQVSAVSPGGGTIQLTAHAGRFGEFDWYAFDQKGPVHEDHAGETQTSIHSLMPIHARFRGMPNARWWQFESGTVNFSDVRADLSESAKIIVIDFMLVHSNDWFVIPVTQQLGSLCRINTLLVHDVFGEVTAINRAGGKNENWSMFTTAAENRNDPAAECFLLPPSAPTSALHGEVIEEVRFLRDEMANSVWAVEHLIENGLAGPWSARERAQVNESQKIPVNDSGFPLKYLIQTEVPGNWIPFIPVRAGNSNRAVDLQRAAMLRLEGAAWKTVEPSGRILRPEQESSLRPYKIREEEIPRTGVSVTRSVQRARWVDGSTHLWILRSKSVGRGEGSSGLQFDSTIQGRPGNGKTE